MKSRWKLLRYELEWLGLRLLAAIVPRLPRPLAVQFGRSAGALAARLDLPGRRVALSNLEAAFGDRFSPAERARITRESYQQFASTMIDLFWNPRINADNYRKLIEFEGWDEFCRTVGPTGPCIIAACHYGNFEWFSLAAGYAGLLATIVSQEFKNPKLDPDLQPAARAVGASVCHAGRRDRETLQNPPARWHRGHPDRSHPAAEPADRGDRLLSG